jgi:predicted nuclease of predicted toxin-antitoxin system
VILTHDLDFGVLLALAGHSGPSVLQVRTEDVLPAAIGERVAAVLLDFASEFELGALATLDHTSRRLRLLPVRSR